MTKSKDKPKPPPSTCLDLRGNPRPNIPPDELVQDLNLSPADALNLTYHGWLSPTGEFFCCLYGEHDILAEELSDGVQTLEKQGWVRVGLANLEHAAGLSWNTIPKRLTQYQKAWVKSYLEYCQFPVYLNNVKLTFQNIDDT